MSSNRSIRDFFRAAPPTALPTSKPAAKVSRTNTVVSREPNTIKANHHSIEMGQGGSSISSAQRTTTGVTLSSENDGPTDSSLVTNQAPLPASTSSKRVIKSSDDEDDEDSDSSLEDLATIFGTKRHDPNITQNGNRPTTPEPKSRINTNFHISPMAIHSKVQFDMNSLVTHARKDNATEASSDRVKAVMASKRVKSSSLLDKDDAERARLIQNAVLESVIGEGEEDAISKVTRALKRTEATVAEKRWYFFDRSSKPLKASSNPFPKGAGLGEWGKELKEPNMRRQSFLSGFVEDMICHGKQLPDELFLWILNEACVESQDQLRTSYLNTLNVSVDQIHRLLLPEAVQPLFQRLGAAEAACDLKQGLRPTAPIANPYPTRNWIRLCSIVRFLGKTGESLQQLTRIHVLHTLLRMSVDRVVSENVDLFVEVQQAISHLSLSCPESEWEATCATICKALFTTVREASFRLQIVDSVSSGLPRTHDLRRRLAMCFFFNDLYYSSRHPQSTINLGRVIDRLEHKDFDARPHTDYNELAASMRLLDVAVDDGRSTKVDLTIPEIEKGFNKDVDDLVLTIKGIMKSIGNPGAAFISRIEAKEVLELVSQRIADTVRTKRQKKESWFDRGNEESEDELRQEKKGMSNFLARMQQHKKENAEPAPT